MLEASPAIAQLFSIGLQLIFYITVLVFLIYTVFVVYHWFAYGTSRATSMIALAIYLLGTAPLLLVMSIML